MISIRRSSDRGHADHGWLDAHHTFSFANYRDPAFMNFSFLRVLNQDRIAAGRGFSPHPHDNMEIVTYVLDGVLEHRDSMGTGSQIRPGEVQLMSAGTGVTHSEFNGSTEEELHLLQMWVFPGQRDTVPRYEQREFPESERRGRFRLVVSPDGAEDSLTIGQDARLFVGLCHGDERLELELASDRVAWLHVARGSVEVNGDELGAGDGAAIVDESALELGNGDEAEVILWDLPSL